MSRETGSAPEKPGRPQRPPLRGATLSVVAPAVGVALFLVALALRACVPEASADDRRCDRGVCVVVREDAQGVSFRGENGALLPIVLRVRPGELENLAPERAPGYRRLGVGEQSTLLRLRVREPGRPWRYTWRWHFGIGDPDAVPDPRVLYDIPFAGGQARRLSQGVGGEFSHTGGSRYAFDFSMPVGTPVVAAREGTVVWVVDGHTKGGPDEALREHANGVTVLHEDGTLGEYLHLQAGIPVGPGEPVERGQLLARSGHTGYSTTPHLHFHVARRRRDGRFETLPIRFVGGRDGLLPRVGQVVEPAAVAR